MSSTVLCTLPLPAPAPQLLEPLAEVRVLGIIPSSEALCDALREGVDVLCPQLSDRIDARVLDAGGERLRAVCIYAAGYNNIDVVAASQRGVLVANTPGVLTDATADCALGLMLAAARRLVEGDHVMRGGEFGGWAPEYMLGLELRDAVLGVVGFGRIGQALARRARACGMRIAYTSDVQEELPEDLRDAAAMPLAQLLEQSDVVSLHVPLTDTTHHLIDEAALRRMKPTGVLVNTSRGPVVDEAALVRALQQGWIAGAGLDVYEDEPRMAQGLAECWNAVLAPHLGSATVRTRAAMAELCARNTIAVLQGDIPQHCINPPASRA